MRPGVDVISRALPPPRSAPTDTGVAFMIGETDDAQQPTPPDVALVRSLTEFVAVFGERGTTAGEQASYDAADVYFHEGGSKLYVSRLATAALGDVETALDAFTKDYGPGQVFVADPAVANIGATQAALLAHAEATNRVALLSAADDDAAGLITIGEGLHAVAGGRYGALFAPSAIIPGVVPGTTRTVPYAVVEAGIISRNDIALPPNTAAAGDAGQSTYALDIASRHTDQEYADLNEASVNMARVIYGGVRTYGYRTAVDPETTPEWRDFGWARLNMAIVAKAEAIGEHFVFQQVDGRGHTLSEFGGQLSAMLADYYDDGSLYGKTPEQAYAVEVGSSVNTEETLANGELHAVLSVRMSPNAEWVVIEIVKVASNESLPGVAAAA